MWGKEDQQVMPLKRKKNCLLMEENEVEERVEMKQKGGRREGEEKGGGR